ncbi:hypothetical protein [Nitrosomonas sp. Nm166]|uniref:hypothetical protein n=1 Tax=Nitrosomonas sp. Nm166 TaxID=1881054 RepID=UPI000B883CCF|nr:hypothetical protein [Nitrosomonas sp. Nm166]
MHFCRNTRPRRYGFDAGKITARFPFIEKIMADGRYAGPIAQENRPRPLEIVKRSNQCCSGLYHVTEMMGCRTNFRMAAASTADLQGTLKNTPEPPWPSFSQL